MKVLVFAAHPDDETIGAGGTIARLSAAAESVILYVATDVYEPRWPAQEKALRRAQAEKAASILGIERVLFGGFRTMHLAATPAIELSGAVSKAVEEIRPEVILAPPPADVNSDHSALFNAALVAARGLASNPVRALYAYEIGTTTRFCGPTSPFRANTYVDISGTMETKLEAMKAYETELKDAGHPRSIEGLKIIARERGLACGCEYAEGLMLVNRRIGQQQTVFP